MSEDMLHVYANIIYDTAVPGTQQDAVQKNTDHQKHGDSDETLQCWTNKKGFRVAAVCVGVLCLLLLAATIGVVVHYFELKEKNKNLAKELNEINTRYSNLTEERDTLKTSLDQLQTSHKILTEERDDLKKRLCESHGFTVVGSVCYYISTVAKNWYDSRQDCRDNQSDLVVIKSKEKQDFVVSLNQNMWLGLTDIVQQGIWIWVDGTPEPTSSEFWNPGEPNGGTRQNCAEVFGGGWNDISCDTPRHYICERVL